MIQQNKFWGQMDPFGSDINFVACWQWYHLGHIASKP